MLTYKEITYKKTTPKKVIEHLLVADVGGTNCNFGVFQITPSSRDLILSIHIKSQQITDFPALVSDVLTLVHNTYHITIERACIAAAGVVSLERDFVKPTNLSFTINTEDIKKKTKLHSLCLANDFEVIGYGIPKIDAKAIVHVKKGTPANHCPQAILGAGTGLGKSILIWNDAQKTYMPLASEGGHADFAPHDALEYSLVTFIREQEKKEAISWEDLLSGYGIARIYKFFRTQNNAPAHTLLVQNGIQPDKIFKSRMLDEYSANTYKLYAKIYARCAKNFALDTLALGGVYIAGGIAAKNLPLFEEPLFGQEFIKCDKQQELLKRIPVYVITDYNVSLYGAAAFMLTQNTCNK